MNEGKTKIIYSNSENQKTVFMVFKDDITAGDGIKHDIMQGKSLIDWQINKDIYELLNKKNIPTHYIDSPEEKVCLVKKLSKKINLEVVSRRVATGSILKWEKIEEGDLFSPLVTQFHYKDDFLHDPMLSEKFINYLIKEKKSSEFAKMKELNMQVFEILEKSFACFNIQLIDIKIEYGIIDEKIYVIDEITGGSFRLWPYLHQNPNFNQKNVLLELNPKGRLDKDTYRFGESLDTVNSKFKEIAKITEKFKELA
ncbi:MAG: phosphoribosylaminoimidazolesuccinocarboxamide synthase [bacterium]